MPAAFIAVPDPVKSSIPVVILLSDYVYYLPLLFLCIIVIRKGNRSGIFLLIGLFLYFISQLEWILSSFNIIPYNLINYLQIKGISYIVLMTVGLGYKIRTMQRSLADFRDNLESRVRERVEEYQRNLRTNKNVKSVTDTTKVKIETVKEYLKENYSYDISREGLASAMDMSPDHLGRMFKQFTGEKISEYINKIRVEEASKRLRDTDEKIIDIAFNVGFESLRTFNNVFTNIMKMSPSQYRKEM